MPKQEEEQKSTEPNPATMSIEYKIRANESLKQGKIDDAIMLYTESIVSFI
jgi:hypothetical protein